MTILKVSGRGAIRANLMTSEALEFAAFGAALVFRVVPLIQAWQKWKRERP